MAPKRRPAAKTVVTAKKVVEETVKLVISPDENPPDNVEVISASEKQNQDVEIFPGGKPEDIETQPVSDSETETTTTPPPPAREKEKKQKQTQKMEKEAGGKQPRQRRTNRGTREGYKTYVYKVMKQVHPDLGIWSGSMTIINNLMCDMFERLAEEAAWLERYIGRRTMSSREVQRAVKLVLPGELGRHAIAEGNKAISNYMSSVSGG